jgi:hypothetical protein
MNKPLTREEWLNYLETTWKKCLADAWQKEWDDMNREEITRMAKEAGFVGFDGDNGSLRRFAALVIANNPPQSSMAWQEGFEAGRLAEREACAKVCDGEATIEGIAQRCAAAIRARGEPEQEPVKRTVMYRPADLESLGLTHEDVVKLIKEQS